MGNVLPINKSNTHRLSNKKIVSKQKSKDIFKQALSELKSETGIDHYKVIMGDEKENKRLKFKHHQDRLLEG